jgi:RNA polymerase sigma-70 factor, ECF subfamily
MGIQCLDKVSKSSRSSRTKETELSEFHRLIEQQIPRLRRYARALTRNRERADDLVQDTLGRALLKERFWQPGTNLRAWLFTIMHNQNVNNVRRDLRESGAVDMEQISVTLPATTDPTASRQIFELERALTRLPLEQRQVILLVGLEGMSYEDTAGILSVPIGTVRSRLSRGRDALRKLFWVWKTALPRRLCRRRPDECHPVANGVAPSTVARALVAYELSV